MTQMSSVWPIDTSVPDFSAVYKRPEVVWTGGWYPTETLAVYVMYPTESLIPVHVMYPALGLIGGTTTE